jgi:ligand-binding SRPBCC domain-containing protein
MSRHRLSRVMHLLTAGEKPACTLLSVRRDTLVPATLEETFSFFSDAANLDRLTPEWLHFEITSPMPMTMREGAEIDYRIRWYGVPIPWRTRIDIWEPGVRFVDRQVLGPYRWWRHEHRFERQRHGTRVVDEVEFLPRLSWISRGLVRRDVERIFTHRQAKLQGIFGGR